MKRLLTATLNALIVLTLMAPWSIGSHAKEAADLSLDTPTSLSFSSEGSLAETDQRAESVGSSVAPTALLPSDSSGSETLPAQLSGQTDATRPSRHGPQRSDGAQGIPDHAYSPFEERQNREHPCPAGRCEVAEGHLLVKLADAVTVAERGRAGVWTQSQALNKALEAQGVDRLVPVFPNARKPRRGEMVVNPSGKLIPRPDLTRWQRAEVASGVDVDQAIEALTADPNVAYAEPDYIRKPVGGPTAALSSSSLPSTAAAPLALPGPGTDPLYDSQWHLSAANVPAAWQWLEDNGFDPGGSRDVVVAVIDTGVDYDHPDLAANMWVNSAEFGGDSGVDDDGNGYVDDVYGADTVTPDGDPQDDHGHGTHVAGIIAAQGNNDEGGVGVAYNVQIMALKAAQYSGVLASSDIAEAITYAVEKGADVINMSFGGYARSQVEEDALAVAFGQAVLVGAAGNDAKVNVPCKFGRDMYPAAYNWVLGVMAHAETPDAEGDYMAGFSNYDCSAHDSHEYELMAPGVDVWSTLPGGEYAAWDGTSMAAPVVSGIAALVRTCWYTKSAYSSRFIMGQIATTGPTMQAYTPVTGPAVFYPVPDGHAALTTVPQPELAYLEHWLFDTADQDPGNDDDGIVDAGEVVDLAITIRNHWGKADPVTVTLEAIAEGASSPDPYVTMITDTVDYGAIGSFNQDDNGLTYSDDVITGVEHPFRFTVPITTPNDHVIPFKLTMTAGNGFDPGAPDQTFTSRFYLIVQNGQVLPQIISSDMTLTNDTYWIVDHPVLIEEGATVTVTEGTQVQFWSADPDDPYDVRPDPFLQVEGRFVVQGTAEDPVEMFPSGLYPRQYVNIIQESGGDASLQYCRIHNPVIGIDVETARTWQRRQYSAWNKLASIDHCSFTQIGDKMHKVNHEFDELRPVVHADAIENCRFRKLGTDTRYSWDPADPFFYMYYSYNRSFWVSRAEGSLFDSCYMADDTGAATDDFRENAFLGNFLKFEGEIEPSNVRDWGVLNDPTDPSFSHNAILNAWWRPDVRYWMRFFTSEGSDDAYYMTNNYWGTDSTTLIDNAIVDFHDNFNLGEVVYQPILTSPPAAAYPFVTDVTLSTTADPDASLVGAEEVTFTVSFNRDMDTTVQPQVSFGPAEPFTDFSIGGDWQDPRTWVGTFNVTPITGDGYQYMRVADAVAADDPWLVTGDDSERFRFEIVTSGSEAMNLQATGGEGYVDLSWTQDDFELLSGFNLYRATSVDGTYTRVNDTVIPPDERTYRDTDVQPGQPYYYRFTVVKSDMSESGFSNVAAATPVDTIPPTITHTPVTEAPPQLPITIQADVIDNVGVEEVMLYFRAIGATDYVSRTMVNTSGDRYAATIEGSLVSSPGLEYYLEADDGVSAAREGQPAYPYQIAVEDRPVVTSVAPDHGPASGGTSVTIAGSNFKAGASVTFGGAVAEDATVVSSSQITCTTPAHFPATVDVTVVNTDTQSGTLLQGFAYQSEVATLSLPDVGGGQYAVVEVPINASDVDGLAAADLTLTFDDAVLDAQGADTGGLTPDWSLVANTDTPGQVTLALASPGGTVSGSGALANVTFQVVGSPAMTSTLHLSSVSLNDGAIPAQTVDGSFAVSDVYDVSGTVDIWQTGGGVPGVLMTLSGDRVYTGTSDATGVYTVTGVPQGDYELTAAKSDDANGISAYDASLVLQHAAGTSTLSGYQATAADVNKSGSITSMDAFYVLQQVVDLLTLPFPGAGVVWDFDPESRPYTDLNSDQVGQDFTAVLLGDVSGSWSASAAEATAASTAEPAVIRVASGPVDGSDEVTVTVSIEPNGAEAYGIGLGLAYDAAAATALSVEKGALTEAWSMADNLTESGEVQVATAGSSAIVAEGELLTLRFRLTDPEGATPLDPMWADVNEGAVPVEVIGGEIGGGCQIYLPLVVSSVGGAP